MNTTPPAWHPTADPAQAERERVFGRRSRQAVLLVGVLALCGALIPGDAGRMLAGTAIAVVVAIPLVRVVWLIMLWRAQRDRRFVWSGLALLGVVILGVIAAALRGS